MRIGLLYPTANPTSPADWSGIPHGLAEGFQRQGMNVVPIPFRMPARTRLLLSLLRRARGVSQIVAEREPVYARARSKCIAAALRQLGHLDAVVAMGADLYDLPLVMRERSVPVATYDDGNFALFLRYQDSDLHQERYPVEAVQFWAQRQAMACRWANIACVCTDWAKNFLVEDFNVPENKVHVVGVGHRPRLVSPDSRNWTAPRFLFVGINWKRKNGAAVVEAFARVRERFPNATLDLVGRHSAIDAPGITDHGFLSRENAHAQKVLDDLFRMATAFVLPSLFEPAGIAYLEAASAGLPVIGTNRGGARELLEGATLSVDPYDRESLVGAMLQLCDMEAARSMGERARIRVANSTWEAVSGRIAERLGLFKISHSDPTSEPALQLVGEKAAPQ
jgi:glycosyltransferase involved in cell wall biosynthesis